MNDEGYGGWKNYPTWCVNLWLGSDEGLDSATLELVARINPDVTYHRSETADAIRSFVQDDLAPDLGASFAADLLGYALDQVDWHEIADAWIEAAEEVNA